MRHYPLKALPIGFAHTGPGPLSAVIIGPATHTVEEDVVLQDADNGLAQGLGILEGNELTTVLGEQFFGSPVGGGDHGFARAYGKGQGAAGQLFAVDVGRDIEIRGTEDVVELFILDKAVIEPHVLVQSQSFDLSLQAEAIGLAFELEYIGMGHTQYHVHDRRIGLNDFGQGLDHVFDALVFAEQPKGQDGASSVQPEFVFVIIAVDKGQIRDAVGG